MTKENYILPVAETVEEIGLINMDKKVAPQKEKHATSVES